MTPSDAPDPTFEQAGVPNDNDTMVGVLDELRDEGYTEELRAKGDEGEVVCSGCGMASDAAELTGVRQRRLEGASDPADMSILITARCPACERKGVLVLGYGPKASESDEAVLGRLPSLDDPQTAGAGPDAHGGEVHEPENSTFDDWFGQNVARDQEVADEVEAESATEEEAEQRFEERAEGEQRYREGHPRPGREHAT